MYLLQSETNGLEKWVILLFSRCTHENQAMLVGGGGVHFRTKLVTFPAADNGLGFLTLSMNLSNTSGVVVSM